MIEGLTVPHSHYTWAKDATIVGMTTIWKPGGEETSYAELERINEIELAVRDALAWAKHETIAER